MSVWPRSTQEVVCCQCLRDFAYRRRGCIGPHVPIQEGSGRRTSSHADTGISALSIAAPVGPGPYRTAWFMLNRLAAWHGQ